jgi:hypothetical protein
MKAPLKYKALRRGVFLRQNSEHRRLWDVLELWGGKLTGRVTFTGTLTEIKAALKRAGQKDST